MARPSEHGFRGYGTRRFRGFRTEFRGFLHHEIIQNESPIIQYLTTCRASIFGARTCPGVPRFTVTTPIPQRSVALSRSRRLSKHRNNHTDQGRKRHDGVGSV